MANSGAAIIWTRTGAAGDKWSHASWCIASGGICGPVTVLRTGDSFSGKSPKMDHGGAPLNGDRGQIDLMPTIESRFVSNSTNRVINEPIQTRMQPEKYRQTGCHNDPTAG